MQKTPTGARSSRRSRGRHASPRRAATLVALEVLLVLAAGCGPARQHRPAITPLPGYSREPYETGCASWYGSEFAGLPTSSGDIFDPRGLTAAHRTLPLGCPVQVTNLENGRAIVVEINDRGPFKAGRVLDCSEGAARKLGFHRQGLTKVAISLPIDMSRGHADRGDFWLQLGAFRRPTNARRLRARLAEHEVRATLRSYGGYTRVYAGPYDGRRQAEKALRKLGEAGFAGYVMRLARGPVVASK